DQPFVFEDDSQTIVVGQEGTNLALVDTRTLVVQQGRIAVLVGPKNDLAIETSFGVINVPANGVVLVDTTNPKVVRVANINV
ncbi:hypothetical protein, partial [Staphylococcus aureus]